MTNVFNVYTPTKSKQSRGAPSSFGERPPPGAGRIRDGYNHPSARRRQSHVRTAPAPQGPQNAARQAPHAQSHRQDRRPSVHPAAGGGVRPPRPGRLSRDGEPLGSRPHPAQRQRRLRKSELTPEQGAAVRALSAPLFDTLIGYGIRKGALLQHCMRAVRDGHAEWRKRLQLVPSVGTRGEPQGSQLSPPAANDQASSKTGSSGPPEKPPAAEGAGVAGNDQPTLCSTCKQHRNVY
nr:MAG: long distance movement protein [Picris umbravirus 1]